MGFFDDAASVISGHSSRKSHKRHSRHSRHQKSRSRSHSRSRSGSRGGAGIAASIFGGSDYRKHNSSKASFFGLGNASRGSFFGIGETGRSPSYYKRSPRPSFLSRAYKKLKRLLRDLMHYARRHPMKVFMLAIMPLITGGALTALLARFGLRMPSGLEKMLGIGAKAMAGDGIGLVGEAVRMASSTSAAGGSGSVSASRGWDDGGRSWEKRSVDSDFLGGALGSLGGLAGGGGGGGGGLMGSVAKFFS